MLALSSASSSPQAGLSRPLLILLSALLMTGCGAGPGSEDSFDVVIRNARIVDGTGNPWYRADVGIRGTRIAAIGEIDDGRAGRVIDAADRVLSPGFIDMHSHTNWDLFVDSRIASKVTQGVTLEVTGEGHSVAPATAEYFEERSAEFERLGIEPDWTTLEEFFERLEAAPPTINFASYIGTGTVRELVVGTDDVPSTPAQREEMERMVAEAMEDGALGVYSALMYTPDRFNSTEDLIAMARVASRYGGVYQTHQRDESGGILASLSEVLRIADAADIPAHITHLKVGQIPNWGMMPEVVRRIETARAEGLEVTADVYPYTWAAGSFRALLPPWAREGTRQEIVRRLQEEEVRDTVRTALSNPATEWENEFHGVGGATGIRVTSVRGRQDQRWMEGRGLDEVAERLDRDPRDVIMDLIVAGGAGFISKLADESDLLTAALQEWTAFGTDGGNRAVDGPLSGGLPHPRAYGTFPRVFADYVRAEGLLTLPEAVRKATSLPAQILGLKDRGLVREGYRADLVIFDPEAIVDRATYDDPHQYAVGVEHVLVNGELVLDRGEITPARPGLPIRGPGYRREGTGNKRAEAVSAHNRGEDGE